MADDRQMAEPGPFPPVFEKFLKQLAGDRKTLLQSKAYTEPAQLRQFVGQFLYPRLMDMFKLVAGVALDAYGLAASNTNEIRALHYFVYDELRRLGADLPDDEEPSLPGVSAAVLNEFQHAFYAIGTSIEEGQTPEEQLKLYQRCAALVDDMVGQLMFGEGADGDRENEDDPDDSVPAEEQTSEPAESTDTESDQEPEVVDEEPVNE